VAAPIAPHSASASANDAEPRLTLSVKIRTVTNFGSNGRFVIVWKFNAGQEVIHPWFSAGTLAESAFPFAPASSRRVIVTVG
jgi:hypothetical protein